MPRMMVVDSIMILNYYTVMYDGGVMVLEGGGWEE